MQIEYHRFYSSCLGRDMEIKSYGHAGKPVLAIPCQNGRFFEWEGFQMHETLALWIDGGRIRLFTVDTVDSETVSDVGGDARRRIERYEGWIHYLVDELVPFIHHLCQSGEKLLVTGFSMGAYHAANLFYRFPQVFDSLISLSGIYDTGDMYGGYMDDLVYLNDPCASIGGMANDHPYIGMYNQGKAVICVGQGPWEGPLLEGTRRFDSVLKSKGVDTWVDYWGYDSAHDWPWWRKQITYFLGKMEL